MVKKLLTGLILVVVLVSGCAKETEFIPLSKTIAVDSSNNIHLVWSDYSDYGSLKREHNIFYKVWNGNEWSKTKIISNETEDNIEPSIFVDSLDNIYVIWSGKEFDSGLYYKYFDGLEWSKTYKLNDLRTWRFSGFMGKDDLLHVAWEERGCKEKHTLSCSSNNIIQNLYYNRLNKTSFGEPQALEFDGNYIYWVGLVVDSYNEPNLFVSFDLKGYLKTVFRHYAIQKNGYDFSDTYDSNVILFKLHIDSNNNFYILKIDNNSWKSTQYSKFEHGKFKDELIVTDNQILSSVAEGSKGNLYLLNTRSKNFHFDIVNSFVNTTLNIKENGKNWSEEINLDCKNQTFLPILSIKPYSLSILCINGDGMVSFSEVDYELKSKKFGKKKGTKLTSITKERIKDISEYNKSEITSRIKSAWQTWLIEENNLSKSHIDEHIILKNIIILDDIVEIGLDNTAEIIFLHLYEQFKKEYKIRFPITRFRHFYKEWYYRDEPIVPDQQDVWEFLSKEGLVKSILDWNKVQEINDCEKSPCKLINQTPNVKGFVTLRYGDCMPKACMSDKSCSSTCYTKKVSRNVMIREATKNMDYLYTQRDENKQELIASTISDEEGYYELSLPPGNYSVFVEDYGMGYCNGAGYIRDELIVCPLVVGENINVIHNININHATS